MSGNMEPEFSLDKLICAIELILFKSLKENSDDSYSHKLIDLVDHVKPKLSLDDLIKLSSVVVNALNHPSAVNDIELSTAFKLLGVIVSDERMIKEKPESVTISFGQMIQFDHLLQNQTDPHYDLQYSFLKCINKLSTTQSGCHLLSQKDDLLLIIFHLLTKSQGFYVQMEAQMVITTLLENVLDKPNVSHKLHPYLHQMLLVNCKSHMECLKNLVQNLNLRRFLIDHFHLDSILLSKLGLSIKQDDCLLLLFTEILAICDPSQESIATIINSLLEAKRFKALITFHTTLLLQHGQCHLDGWKLFTIYPLVHGNLELSNLIPGDQDTKSSIAENVTNAEIMFSLRCINREIIDKIPPDDHLFCLNCIGHYLKEPGHSQLPKKIISEALQRLNCLWQTSDDPILVQRTLEIFLHLIIDTFQDSVSLKSLKFLLFKSVREIIDSRQTILPHTMFHDICLKINDILITASSKEDFDLVDSTLEIMIAILQHDSAALVGMCPDLIESFLNYWTCCYQTSNDLSLIASCVPILLCLDCYAPADLLGKHKITKNETIPVLLTGYLTDGEYLLRNSVIEAIQYNFPSLIASDLWNAQCFKMFTQFYGLPMSQLILSEIDSEVLSNITQIWLTFVEKIIAKKESDDKFNLIQMLYESGFFTSLYLLLKDELVTGKVKEQASQGAQKMIRLFQAIGLTKSVLLIIFKNSVEPTFFITVDNFIEGSNQSFIDREQVIDDIFRDHATLPTQDLINVVTEQLHGSKKLTKQKREIGDISLDIIASFFTTLNEKGTSEESVHHVFAILEDIIAARSFDTKIPSDCY